MALTEQCLSNCWASRPSSWRSPSSGDVTLPEAVVVKKESARSVAMAMEMMREIPQKTVLQVRINSISHHYGQEQEQE